MPEGYLHLTCEQRCQIYALLQSGRSQAHIARQIGVDPSTVSRELVRNTGARGYRFKQAHEKASQRRQEASDKPRKMTPDLVELIEEKLTQEQWSPDQISGRLAKDGVAFISHERIYQHVWKDKKDGGTLYLHLRHSGKKYNRRKGKNSGRGLIPNRVDIDQRPPIVAAKSRIGDWEADTIIGANHKGVVMSHVERTSKYTKLAKLPDKNADSVVQACARVLLPLADQIETITYDNGKEFASHAQIATSLGALSYFAKPYHSWERGLNEHTNGLFRQYFPKGSDFSILSDADVQRVEDKLNSRPRKILGYQTPREIFFSARNLPVALHCFLPPDFAMLCMPVFLAVRWKTILAWDSTSHGGKMPEGYLHLTCEQRCQIYALLQSGRSQAHIARQIGVDPSTISRELVRNTGARGYRFKQAHEKASQRRQEASDKPRKMTPDLVELIEEKLTQEQWSPDQISGRLAKDGVAFISHERIYQHVWKDKKDGHAVSSLASQRQKIRQAQGQEFGARADSNRVDIDQRPPIVAAKSRIGDWEADTIIGANHKGVVMSHVERTSKYTKLAKLPDKNADSVVQACARVLLPLADQIETITYDNGKEFASHAQIATSLGALSYFRQALSLVGTRPQRTH